MVTEFIKYVEEVLQLPISKERVGAMEMVLQQFPEINIYMGEPSFVEDLKIILAYANFSMYTNPAFMNTSVFCFVWGLHTNPHYEELKDYIKQLLVANVNLNKQQAAAQTQLKWNAGVRIAGFAKHIQIVQRASVSMLRGRCALMVIRPSLALLESASSKKNTYTHHMSSLSDIMKVLQFSLSTSKGPVVILHDGVKPQ